MRRMITSLLLLGLASPCLALDPPRPKVCLALSGGGARGFAHIGVLKALEQLRIPIDCIAGTSMGSIVGGLYASGLSATDLETIVAQIDWQDVLLDSDTWSIFSPQAKQEQHQLLTGLEFGLGSDSGAAPSGALAGQRLQLLLRRLVGQLKTDQFDQLAIPFRAVATDLNRAEPYVMSEGDLARSMRASMAIPLIFEPVKLDGRLLVDGGVLNNLPVDVARDMGADIVIAVNISSPLGRVQNSSSLFSVGYQAVDAALLQNTFRSLAEADLVISPELGEMSAADFELAAEMIEIGVASVFKRQVLLQALTVDPRRYDEWKDSLSQQRKAGSRTIEYIEFVGNQRISTARLQALTNKLLGEPLSYSRLERAAARILSLETLVTTDYILVSDAQGRDGVRFNIQEKSWGPSYLRLGFFIETDPEVSTEFKLLLQHRRMDLNVLGGHWANRLTVGTEFGLESEFYQPLDARQQFFVAPYLAATRDPLPIFVEGDKELAVYDIDRRQLGVDLGINHSNTQLRLGLWRGRNQADLDIGMPGLPEYRDGEGALRLRVFHDSLNKRYFADRGFRLSLEHNQFLESLGAETDYRHTDVDTFLRIPGWHDSAVHLQATAKWVDGAQLPDSAFVTLGGLDDLSGYPTDALIGQTALAFRAGIQSGVQPLKLPLVDAPRLVALLHAGQVWRNSDQVRLGDLQYGATVGLSMDLLGAIVFAGVGYTENVGSRLYVRLGSNR